MTAKLQKWGNSQALRLTKEVLRAAHFKENGMGYRGSCWKRGLVMTYVPKQGDIIMMNFSPQSGHEQAGARPALIVSNDTFYKFTRMAVVCPITNTENGFPLHIKLDTRTKTTGVIE